MNNSAKSVTLLIAAAAISFVLAGCSPADPPQSSAACAQPEIESSTQQAHPGEAVTITGKWFMNGCNDVIVKDQNGVQRRTYIPPTQNISVEVSAHNTRIASVILDADSVGAISYQFTVPLEQETGMIAVSAGAAEPISVEVVQ